MYRVRVALLVTLFATATGYGAQAATIKDLQGAWAMKGSKCEEIFRKVGSKIEFKDRIASTTTGLLFAGNKVAGPMAVCTVTKIRKKSSHLSAQLSCETSMIVENVSVGFDIPNPSELKRFDPFGENTYVTYRKCDL